MGGKERLCGIGGVGRGGFEMNPWRDFLFVCWSGGGGGRSEACGPGSMVRVRR